MVGWFGRLQRCNEVCDGGEEKNRKKECVKSFDGHVKHSAGKDSYYILLGEEKKKRIRMEGRRMFEQ